MHPDYGTLADVKRFIAEAHKRGHAGDHRAGDQPHLRPASLVPARAQGQARLGGAHFYVWSDTDQLYSGTRIIFLDTEKSNWTWDPVAGRISGTASIRHQPDLNFDNPQVLKAVLGVMRFWLDLGVDGLRLDAVPYLIERDGTNNENLPETHAS